MARPFKSGLQYFPLDVNFFDDEKILDLNIEYGILGEIIYLRMLTMVYANGYYLELTPLQVAKHLYHKIGNGWTETKETLETIIKYLGVIGLFDNRLLMSGVITSRAIQKQYLLSSRRRKKVEIYKHWLLNQAEMLEINTFFKPSREINVDHNQVSDNDNEAKPTKTAVKVSKSTQKEKEKKKEIDKMDKLDKGILGAPKLHYLTHALVRNKYLDDGSLEIGKYNTLFKEVIEIYGFDDCLTAVNYIVQYAKHASPPIDDKFAFMRRSLFNNLEMFNKRRNYNHESFEDFIKRTLL